MTVDKPSGFFDKNESCQQLPIDPYGIPLSCLISKNFENLFLAGRNAGMNHLAMASARVMKTCAVEGEAKVAEHALSLEFQAPVHHTQLHHLPPAGPVDVVEEIKIQVVSLEPPHLLVEDGLGLIQRMDQGRGQLAGEEIALPGIGRKRASDKIFAGAIVVEISGVEIVDAAAVGPVQHGLRLRLVNAPVRARGETHTAEAQQGRPYMQLFHLSVFHLISPSSVRILFCLGGFSDLFYHTRARPST